MKQAIDRLGTEDRLFIVGDLFDKGTDSLGVYKMIKAAKENGKTIIVTRGNHEELLLDALRFIKKTPKEPKDFYTRERC